MEPVNERHHDEDFRFDTQAEPRFYVLIDHGNCRHADSQFVKNVISTWFNEIRSACTLPRIVTVDVRAYGGWFDGDMVTEERYDALSFYQTRCPSLLLVESTYCRFRFHFADDLILPLDTSGQGLPIRGTVAERSRPLRLSRRPGSSTCADTDCELRSIQRWLRKSSACPKANCPHSFATMFRRLEQKQVDVHLSMDMVTLAARPLHHIAIVSDDTDFIPALARAGYSAPTGTTVWWLTTQGCSSAHTTSLLTHCRVFMATY